MVDEHTSMAASRREVRDSIDEHLDTHGAELVASLLGGDPAQAKREVSVDDPANEQGAQALMAMAAGGRRP